MKKKHIDSNTLIQRINMLILTIVVILGIAICFYPKYKRQHELEMLEQKIDREIALKEKEIKNLKQRQKALIEDKDLLEQIARDKLGYSNSEEIIYKFDKNGKNKKKP